MSYLQNFRGGGTFCRIPCQQLEHTILRSFRYLRPWCCLGVDVALEKLTIDMEAHKLELLSYGRREVPFQEISIHKNLIAMTMVAHQRQLILNVQYPRLFQIFQPLLQASSPFESCFKPILNFGRARLWQMFLLCNTQTWL